MTAASRDLIAAFDALTPEEQQQVADAILRRTGPPRVAGLHPGAIQPAPDFDAPLRDDFWVGQS